jgi:hypothetical protein
MRTETCSGASFRLLQTDAWIQSANSEVIVPGVRGRKRDPGDPQRGDGTVRRTIQMRKAAGHDAHDGVARVVDLNRAADRAGVLAETPPP